VSDRFFLSGRLSWEFENSYKLWVSNNPLADYSSNDFDKRKGFYGNYHQGKELVDFAIQDLSGKENYLVVVWFTETHVPYLDNKEDRTREMQIKAGEYLDNQVGRLMDSLKGWYIVFSDHADVWGEDKTPYYHDLHLDKRLCREENYVKLTDVFLAFGEIE
jgi:hypothetical protein